VIVLIVTGWMLGGCVNARGYYEDLRVDPVTLEVTWSRETDAFSAVRPLYEVWFDRARGFGSVFVQDPGADGIADALYFLELTGGPNRSDSVTLRRSAVYRQVYADDELKISMTEDMYFGGMPYGELGSTHWFRIEPITYQARWNVASVSEIPAVDRGRPLLVSLLRMAEQDDGRRVFGAVSYGPTGEAVRTASTCTIRPEDPIGTPDPSEGSRYRCSYGPGSAGRASDLLGFPPRIDTAVLSSVESLGTALDPLDLDMVLRHYDNGRLVLRSMRDPAGRWRHDALTYHPLVIEGMLEPLVQRIDYGLGVTSSGSRAP
jgi:hypothetical protein